MKEGGISREDRASSPLKQIIHHILRINIICFIQMIKSLIFQLVIFFLHLSSTYTLSTKSFIYDNQQSSKFRHPIFNIGNVLSDTTINLQLMLKVGLTDLSSAKVQLIKTSDSSVINSFSCSGTICSQDYYVDSSSGTQMSIRIYAPDSTSFPPNIEIYNLFVRSYRGFITDSPTGMRTLVRATDILREEIVRVIYTNTAKTLRFSIYPIPTELSNPEQAIRVFKVDPQKGWQTGYSNSIELSDDGFTIVQPGVGADVMGLYDYSATVEKGFYALVVTYNVGTPNMKITWQTDSYECPYSSSFPDVNSIFTGCAGPTNPASGSTDGTGLSSNDPCSFLDPLTNICRQCNIGFFLSTNGVCLSNSLCPPGKFVKDGKCITNNPLCLRQDPDSGICVQCIFGFFASTEGQCLLKLNCPDRQFFSNGMCLDVSVLCGEYSQGGLCTSCSDPSSYYLQEGKCIKRQLTCGSRQFISSNNTCMNVSELCGFYNPNNGACLSCKNSEEEDLVNGTCKKTVLNCNINEYQSGKSCLQIPPECFKFDKSNKVCLECFRGYTLSEQKCVQVTCPERFYFSLSSQACVQVSQLCQIYDKATGACRTCKDSNYKINSQGKCMQIINPLAGCIAREQLGYGECISPQQNCKIYNLDSQTCDECVDLFQLDFAGHCSLKAKCSENELSVNGLCLRSPDNCQKVDSIGLCTKCISADYRIVLGQCVLFKKCTGNRFLNSFGECIDVDPLCLQFNPSNGDCITCVQAETRPNLGRCCPIGQLFNGKLCQSITAQSNQSRDPAACLQYHSSLYICLKCNSGYASDYSFKGTCVKE